MDFFVFFLLCAFRVVLGFHEIYMNYYLINMELTWSDAQQYCRESYIDLATVSSMEDMTRLNKPSTYTKDVWVGMFDDPASWEGVMGNDSNSWRWSATGTTSPGGFQTWKSGEPNNYNSNNYCVHMSSGVWADAYCGHTLPFVCFTGSPEQGAKEFTLVTTSMSWEDAQSYCRQHHTDLAMIENETENSAAAALSPSLTVWIGLYRKPWRWSDGSTSTFTDWDIGQPDNSQSNQNCVKLNRYNKWYDAFCTNQFAFICEKAVQRKHVHFVKMKLQAAVDLSGPSSVSILNQIQAHLLNMGFTDFNLKWKIPPQTQTLR